MRTFLRQPHFLTLEWGKYPYDVLEHSDYPLKCIIPTCLKHSPLDWGMHYLLNN